MSESDTYGIQWILSKPLAKAAPATQALFVLLVAFKNIWTAPSPPCHLPSKVPDGQEVSPTPRKQERTTEKLKSRESDTVAQAAGTESVSFAKDPKIFTQWYS